MSKDGLKKLADPQTAIDRIRNPGKTIGSDTKKLGDVVTDAYTGVAKGAARGVKGAMDSLTPDMPEPQSIEPPVQQSLIERVQTSDRRQNRRRGLAGTLFAGRASAGGRQSAPLQRKTLLGGGS